MRIAFTTKGKDWNSKIDPRFCRTEFLIVFDEISKELIDSDNRDSANDGHGVGPKTAQKLFDLNVDVLITGNGPGGNASSVLEKAGVKVYIGAGEMTVKEAYNAYKSNKLKSL